MLLILWKQLAYLYVEFLLQSWELPSIMKVAVSERETEGGEPSGLHPLQPPVLWNIG